MIRVDPECCPGVLIGESQRGIRCTESRRGCEAKALVGVMRPPASTASSQPKLTQSRSGPSPRASRDIIALWTSWLWNPGFYNCKRMIPAILSHWYNARLLEYPWEPASLGLFLQVVCSQKHLDISFLMSRHLLRVECLAWYSSGVLTTSKSFHLFLIPLVQINLWQKSDTQECFCWSRK